MKAKFVNEAIKYLTPRSDEEIEKYIHEEKINKRKLKKYINEINPHEVPVLQIQRNANKLGFYLIDWGRFGNLFFNFASMINHKTFTLISKK